MSKSFTIPRQAWSSWMPFLIVFGLVVVVLYCLHPYSSGWADFRISIFKFAKVMWDDSEDWQHCYLVPFGVAAMVWFKRSSLANLPAKGSWIGLCVLIFGLFWYWAGFRADNIYVGYSSFMVVSAGLIIWLLGWKWMAELAFPWAFMVFLFPLMFLDNYLAFPLRMIMSEVSVQVLNIIGIGAVKVGTAIISAPEPLSGIKAGARFSVDVADPCSGIRSLFALMMVSALYGFFTQDKTWKKIAIFLFSIPLAVAGNLVRIIMLTIGVIVLGADVAIGSLEHPTIFHMAAGYVVFLVALAGMLGIGWCLNKNWIAVFQNTKKNLQTPSPNSSKNTRGKPEFRDEY